MKPRFEKFRHTKTLIVVISGPSGVGKDAVITKLSYRRSDLYRVITTTTRPKRTDELDKKDYNFISKTKFINMINRDEFLEWSKVYNHYYGIPIKQVTTAIGKYNTVIIKVDVQGARKLRRIILNAIFIFIMPSSFEELAKRLKKRGNSSDKDLVLRIKKAKSEINNLSIFDYAVTNKNDLLSDTISRIEAIFIAENCRVKTGTIINKTITEP
jgi:guanylate kinase